ncbi:MAG: VWA domain-containing protein [Acidobacteria bacterium]|nr:VWA domain-containing protein [Acidobacteriota bacterium]
MSDRLRVLLQSIAADWQTLDLGSVTFWQGDIARLSATAFVMLLVLLLAVHLSWRRGRGAGRVVLPALLRSMPSAHASWWRHVPALLVAAGVPFAVIALADPRSSLTESETTYPGRRIALMIDASDSMRTPFTAPTLNSAGTQQAFFTTIAAAQRFVELRRQGPYRDLMALIEFGNRAYVITPFTNDYDNLRLSIALIGDPAEFSKFPDPGTVIGSAVEQAVGVFKAFDYLEAAGNLMVIFTDGEDTNAAVNGRSLDDILKAATDSRIPLYFVRVNFERGFNEAVPDMLWKDAVERAGGRFYIARDESSLLQAIADIDRESVGAIQVRRYATQEARFAPFALAALALWLGAATLRLTLPVFSTVP